MNNYAKIYWLTRLDGINSFFIGMAIISILLIIGIIIGVLMSKDFDEFHHDETLKSRIKLREKFMSKIKYLVFTFFLGILVSIFLPTQKEAIIIIAGGKTIDFVQQDTSISKIPEQTTLLISSFFDKQIKELNEPTKNKQKINP